MNRDIIDRALSAYYRRQIAPGEVRQQPSADGTTVETREEKTYVIVRNTGGILAVYRVRNDGQLKALRRHPFTE
jgi:hypothetical protein